MAVKGRELLTLPNAITIVRLAGVPVFLWLLWAEDRPAAAAVMLAVLGATDWVDGYIARRYDMGSELGKILDPVADRVLLLTAVIALLTEDLGTAINVVLVLVLVREALIASATIALAIAGARRIDVVWTGKAGTLAIMFALPLLLLADVADTWAWFFELAGWMFALGGLALGWYAASRYIPEARRALREGREARILDAEVST